MQVNHIDQVIPKIFLMFVRSAKRGFIRPQKLNEHVKKSH